MDLAFVTSSFIPPPPCGVPPRGSRDGRKPDYDAGIDVARAPLRGRLTIPKRHVAFKTHEAQDDADLTDDYLVERLVICGTVNQEADQNWRGVVRIV